MTRTLTAKLTLWVAATLAAAGCTTVKPEPLPDAPKIVSFTATPTTLAKPGKVTLAWETQHATKVEIRDGAGAPIAGVDDRASGTLEVDVAEDALFVLAARNARGVLDAAAVPVRLTKSPKEITFVGTPATVLAGEAAILAWSVPGARELSLATTGGTMVDLKGQLSSGTVMVTPETTTTYELTVGTEKRQVTLTVVPNIVVLAANPTAAVPGAPLVISWKTRGATKVTLLTSTGEVVATETDAAKVSDGSASIAIPATASAADVFSYTLLAEVDGGERNQKSLSVFLSGAPQITTLTVPEYGVAGGTFTATWQTRDTDVLRISAGDTILYESPSQAAALSGSVAIKTPALTTQYTITAINLRGGAVSQNRSVGPVAKTTLTAFDANPQPGITAGGEPVTLSWTVPGARRLKISVANQYTVFTARGPSAETGTITVYPNENTEYTLDADNTIGDVVQGKKNVNVTNRATFTAPTGALLQGNPAPLTYAVGGGTAAIYGLSHFDVVTTTGSTGFLDIKATGTKVTFGSSDDTTTSFSLTTADFETWLFGARATGTVTVGTNGFMAFGSFFSSRPLNESLPTVNADTQFLAPFWDDLQLGPTGALYWQVVGEAPERKLVVQWDDFKIKGDATSALTFQAQISQQGVVTYEYKTVTTSSAPSVTIGAQGPLKTQGVTYSGAVPSSGTRLTFFGPKTSPTGPVLQELGPYVGWVKIGDHYLKLSFTATSYIKRGDLIVSEVLAQPAAAIAATGEWLELFNNTANPVDLAGWTLDFGGGNTHVLAAAGGSTIVPAKGYLLLGQSNVAAENDGVSVQYVYGPTFAMPDAAGAVNVRLGGYAMTGTWGAGMGGPGASVGADQGLYLVQGDASTALPHPLSCTSITPFGTQTPQQLGSPGTGSACFKYALSSRAVAYKDISATGTALIPAGQDTDEGMYPLDITSAPFTSFGAATNLLSVSTNGFISFKTQACPASSTLCYFSNKVVPNSATDPFGILAPYWTDLDHDNPGANIFAKRMAAGADPVTPAAHWIIQWHKTTHFASSTDNLNFQVKLFDDGAMEIHYGTLTSTIATYANGADATVWLEEPTGKTAKVISVEQPLIAPNSAYRFTPL